MVGVVADSASNVPEHLARELGVELVPLWLKLGPEEYRDGVDMLPDRFYERLVTDREPAATATPSPADFLAAFERTRQRDIVCITVASTMSAAHHEATMAAERFHGRVLVVDSTNASMAEGFVALEAARLARTGASLGEVAARAGAVAERASLFATVGTFEFLRRSGRVNTLQAYAATVLDIKPVFSFRHGAALPVARPRTRRRAVERIVAETLRRIGDRPAHVAAIHAAAEDEARRLVERIIEGADVVEWHVVAVTPVIGAHTGPGLLGTAFFTD
jgi:DegV family protein with EDD domain